MMQPNPPPFLAGGTENLLGATEGKDVKRVFNYLAGCHKRENRKKVIEKKKLELAEIVDRKEEAAFEIKASSPATSATSETPMTRKMVQDLTNEAKALEAEIDGLQSEVRDLETDPSRKVEARDMDYALKTLYGRVIPRKQLEFMIWEVDENLDGGVDWEEFELMYFRNMTDQSGLEPFDMFNIVQFMTYDNDMTGRIAEDDTMATLYLRYGKDHVESQINKLFGHHAKSNGGMGVLELEDYLSTVSVRKPRKTGIVSEPDPPKKKDDDDGFMFG
mmetsp:Transcript_21777/g.50169  ORF Transcript_21777/g.50169 Transcript_21777/m.50169 type:complete len:275 (+) Transcript_21777:172-996(+)|eukprot:CAMPEP_0182595284 /NCGR_PEP_ID=MMETSP1324-20130603/81915_1 /TAXON_ID=236786 /ORGANISM="Florenciella sp., Strain RCC1587" /LENGTH=274 /DNA_ID=CAMNT_0024812873 /DNA_START=93 /DNA_END=917 /DNA_ORIENTATION=-